MHPLVIVGILLAFMIGSAAVVSTYVVDEKIKQTLGWRLNNPGNVERGESWLGLAPQQLHHRYATFIAPEFGIRALARVLRTYHAKYGLNTVQSIISRYAPAHENPTDPYIANIARWAGVNKDQPINVPALLLPLASGIIRQEIGYGVQPYPDAVLRMGIDMEKDYGLAQRAVANPGALASTQFALV